MRRPIENRRQCESIQDELVELSLGVLNGRDRCEVWDHVASCSRCATALEELSHVADTLLLLAPDIEPPLGFEVRVAERQDETAPAHQLRGLRRASRPRAVAAVVVLIVVGISLMSFLALQGDTTHHRSTSIASTSAELTSDGHALGEVSLSTGKPAWMSITVNGAPWSGTVTCEVTFAGSETERIGVFALAEGSGAWSAPLAPYAGKVRSARLVTSDGAILASAGL